MNYMGKKVVLNEKENLSVQKEYFIGTERIISPSETWKNISIYLKPIGISRVANITGLDCLNIPVTTAIRPRSKSLCVSAGKGLSLEQAMVSAAMESIEIYHAENIDQIPFVASYNQLKEKYSLIQFENLPLRKHSVFNTNLPVRWIIGWDIINQVEVPVPYDMVTMNFESINARNNLAYFQTGSNGLASGNHYLEAILSGIYEVIERDAITLSELNELKGLSLSQIKINTIPYMTVQTIIKNMEKANVVPLIYDCTVNTCVPTFCAVIYNKKDQTLGAFSGYGTHLNPEIALIRALTEAAQGRCVYISGARDDMFSHDRIAAKNGLSFSPNFKGGKDFSEIDIKNQLSQNSFEADLKKILQNLKNIDIKQTLIVDLTKQEFNIPVYKVIIPGLEGYLSEMYSAGNRAKKILETSPENLFKEKTKTFHHMPAGKGA